jgi:hypothetical protein
MLAMIFSSPPQRVQLSISTPNTRFSRRAQLIATCLGVDGLVGSAPATGGGAARRPRCADVTGHGGRDRPDSNATDQPTLERLRAELSSANTLARQLVALLDHYVAAYQEMRDLLAQRDRELAEERRSRGSTPTKLRR